MPVNYILAWFGMMVFAVLNGAIRDFTYKPYVGALAAHQISTLTLLLIFAAFFRLLVRRWPIVSGRQAWIIGSVWLVMTLLFEFGVGRYGGRSWSELFQAYDVSSGQVWIVIPLWVLIGPYVWYRIAGARK